jgi:hypothetical protein
MWRDFVVEANTRSEARKMLLSKWNECTFHLLERIPDGEEVKSLEEAHPFFSLPDTHGNHCCSSEE